MQAENDFSDICYKLFSLVFCIIFYLLCTRSSIIRILGSQDHFLLEVLIKVIKLTIKFKICFQYPHIPFCNFQNSVSEKMWCCLTFVCVYIHISLVVMYILYMFIQNKPFSFSSTLVQLVERRTQK